MHLTPFSSSGAFGIGAGVAAYSSVGLLFGIGPIGWAILGFGAALAGLAFLFVGSSLTDDQIQVWIRSTCLGTAPTYKSSAEEQLAFEKIFAKNVDLRTDWQVSSIFGGRTGGTVTVEISPPRADSEVDALEYTLRLIMSDGRRYEVHENRRVMQAPGEGMRDPDAVANGGRGRIRGLAPATYHSKFLSGDGRVTVWKLDYLKEMLARVEVDVKYWPDRTVNPELAMPVRTVAVLPKAD